MTILVTPVWAESSAQPPSSPPVSPSQLLQQMADAFRGKNYHGRFFYSNNDSIRSLQVFHKVDDKGVETEHLLHLSGELSEIVRHGDKVSCFHPNNALTQMRKQLPPASLGERFSKVVASGEAIYRAIWNGDGRVADRSAYRIELRPKDNSRYGYMLWIDKDSSLLLKSMMLDEQGKALEIFEFVELEVGGAIPDEWLEPRSELKQVAVQSEQKEEHEPPTVARNDLANGLLQRWKVMLPNGFTQSNHNMKRMGDGDDLVSSRLYTDGLAAFSLFLQMTDGDESLPATTREGATVAVSRVVTHRNQKQFILTLVGEVPVATGKQVIESFQWLDN